MLHSLVRVSRRVGWDRLGASDLSAHRDCTATPPSRSAGTARSPHRSDAVAAAVRLALLGRRPPLSSVSAASRPRGQHRDPKDSANCPAGRTAQRKLPLTGPRGSAVESDERSHRRRVPEGIPPPEGAHRSACSHRGPSRPHSLPSQRFHALFDSLSKVLFIFPSRYLFAIGLVPVFSLRWSLPPALGCNPKQPDSPKRPRVPQSVAPAHGAITLSGAPFLGDFGRTAAGMALLQTTIRRCTHRRLQAWAVPASLAATGGILVSFFSSAY